MAIISTRVVFKDELYKSGWYGIDGYGVGMVYWVMIIWFILFFYWGHTAEFEGEQEQFSLNHELIERVAGIKINGSLIAVLSLVFFDFGCDGLTERSRSTPSLAQLDVYNEARFYQVGLIDVREMRHQKDTYITKGKTRRRYARIKAVAPVINGGSEGFRSYLSHERKLQIKGSFRPESAYLKRLHFNAREALLSAPLVDQCVQPLNRLDRKRLTSLLPSSSSSNQLRVFTMVEAEHCEPRLDWLYLPLGLALFGYELWLLWGLLLIRQEETQKILSTSSN